MKNQKTANNICILTILTLGGLSVMASVGLTQEDTWTKKTDMPTPRWGLSTSAVNGNIYAIGDRGPLSTVEDWGMSDQLGLMQQLGIIPPDREDFSWGTPSEVTGDPGDPATNRAIVQLLYDEVWNTGNMAAADEILAADFVYHDPTHPQSPVFHPPPTQSMPTSPIAAIRFVMNEICPSVCAPNSVQMTGKEAFSAVIC